MSALLLAVGAANADFVGFNLDAQRHYLGTSNNFISRDSSIDIVDDLGSEQSGQSSMVLILEHPIAVLPNVRYQGFNLDSSGDRVSSQTAINGDALSASNDPSATFDLEHDNIVLYYQLLNNWVDLDMGVDLKHYDGQVSSLDSTAGDVEIDETIPLLHLSARIKLPINGLYVGANINAAVIDLGISDSNAQDSTIMLGYDSGAGIGIEGGFKTFSLQLNETDSLNTDLEYDGLFLNGYFNF